MMCWRCVLSPNQALLSDKFSAALQICRRARRYVFWCSGYRRGEDSQETEPLRRCTLVQLCVKWCNIQADKVFPYA